MAKSYLVLLNLFRADDVDEDVKKKITPVLDTFRTALADRKEVLFRGDNEKDLLKTFLEELAKTEDAMYMAAILSFLDGTDPAPTDESGPQKSGRRDTPESRSTPGEHPHPDRPEGASRSQSAPKDRAWWRVHEAGFGIPLAYAQDSNQQTDDLGKEIGPIMALLSAIVVLLVLACSFVGLFLAKRLGLPRAMQNRLYRLIPITLGYWFGLMSGAAF